MHTGASKQRNLQSWKTTRTSRPGKMSFTKAKYIVQLLQPVKIMSVYRHERQLLSDVATGTKITVFLSRGSL